MPKQKQDDTPPQFTIVGSDRVPVDTLTPHPDNSRRGDLSLIMRSLRQYGQFRRIVVNRHSGYITMGNHVFMAARQLGWSDIDVDYIDEPDPEREMEMVLIDNRASDLSGWDDSQLHEQLRRLDDADRVGWTDDDLEYLKVRLSPLNRHDSEALAASQYEGNGPPPDDAPPPTAPPGETGSPGESRGLGQPIISYQIVFDDEDQKRLWVEFIKWLRANVDGETNGERLAQFIDGQGITA